MKLNLYKKIHLRRPDLRFYMEFSSLGSYKTGMLETAAGVHASLEEPSRQVMTLSNWYPEHSAIQCITKQSTLSPLQWLEIAQEVKNSLPFITLNEASWILNEAELYIMISSENNWVFLNVISLNPAFRGPIQKHYWVKLLEKRECNLISTP